MWLPRSLHPTTERATSLILKVGEEKWEFWRYDMNKIMILGYCWKSQQNGAVYDVGGVSPCLNCGQHSGVEPKIMEVRYEEHQTDKDR